MTQQTSSLSPVLRATSRAKEYQAATTAKTIEDVIHNGKPYVIASATTPHEIFHAMGIPVITNEWYSALTAAKRLSAHYFGCMDEMGFDDALPRYATLPFITTLVNDGKAPFGGLPKPMMIVQSISGEYAQKIGEQWSAAFGGVPYFGFDISSPVDLKSGWYSRGQSDWETVFEPHRVDFQHKQLLELIAVVEHLSGKCLDRNELEGVLHRVNQAAEQADRAKRELLKSPGTPVPIPEQFNNIMAATWNRGSQWAVDHLTAYADEIAELVKAGSVIVKEEKARLLWLNNALWQNTGFYRRFEESHQATFVWTLYSNFFSDGYRKYFLPGEDPLRSLAARHISMSDILHLPGWMSEWVIRQAQDYRADAAVMLVQYGDRLSSFGTKICMEALERAGIPIIPLVSSSMDARLWNDDEMYAMVANFLESRVIQ